jgi:hypothetical protein
MRFSLEMDAEKTSFTECMVSKRYLKGTILRSLQVLIPYKIFTLKIWFQDTFWEKSPK